MDKPQLRKNIIHYLQTVSLDDRTKIEHVLTNNLLAEKIWEKSEMIGITISQANEWNTRSLIKAAWEQGKKVCVPKCYPSKKELVFFQFESFDQLEVVFYNLQEPIPEHTTKVNKKAIDLLVVPGLLFDRNGYRVGFGGGYYDRFLADFSNETVSLLSAKQLVDKVPFEEFDIPVQHLITEKGKVK